MATKHKFLVKTGRKINGPLKKKVMETFDFDTATKIAVAAGWTPLDAGTLRDRLVKTLMELLDTYVDDQCTRASTGGFTITWCNENELMVNFSPSLISHYERVRCLHEDPDPRWSFCPMCGARLEKEQ